MGYLRRSRPVLRRTAFAMCTGVLVSLYRVYLLSPAGRIASPPLTPDLADDEAVIAYARQLRADGAPGVEVWESSRLVFRDGSAPVTTGTSKAENA